MVRTQLYLHDDIHRKLRRIAREQGTTISELVRRALQQVYSEEVSAGEWTSAVDAVAGLWADRDDIDDGWSRRIRSGSRRMREVASSD